MKDSEFIELLNLYLDHEISAADAARLEAEVQNNPARRRVYQDYCRMQKACKMMAEEFQHESVVVPEPSVIDFEAARRRSRMGNFYTVGAFVAAAACVAIIFVGRSREQAANATRDEVAADAARPVAVQPAVPVVAASTAGAPTADLPSANRPAGPTLLGNQLYLSRKLQPDTTMRPAAEQTPAQFAWMEQIQLAPIQPHLPNQDLRFDAPSSTLRTEPRTFNNGQQPVDANVEMTAFRFQR